MPMNNGTNQKVTAAHLSRMAYLYVRQSTLRQVFENTESTQRQYGLRSRAVALGWPIDRIVVIDSDLGQSGASAADREGFQRLVTEVSLGRVGIVLGLEVSRLARNNTDWHRLLELCALSDTLILDEDGLYDPSCWRPYSTELCAIFRCFRLPDLSAWIPAIVSAVSGNRNRFARISRWILIMPLRMERLIQ